MSAKCLSKPHSRLWKTSDGWWHGYSRKVYGYTLPEMTLEMCTRSKSDARAWWKSKK